MVWEGGGKGEWCSLHDHDAEVVGPWRAKCDAR